MLGLLGGFRVTLTTTINNDQLKWNRLACEDFMCKAARILELVATLTHTSYARLHLGTKCQGHSSLCEFASGTVSTLGYRYLTYPQNLSELPFLPNKLQALVAKWRGDRTGGGAERVLQAVDSQYRS